MSLVGSLPKFSKAFESINNDLLIAKLYVDRLCMNALELIQNSLEKGQRVKINCTLCAWKEIHVGVPRGLAIAALLFNVFK